MIPNITRGSRMGGLMSYLAGPGRANQHESARIVAGDDILLARYAGKDISRATALEVAQHLDWPCKNGVEIKGGHVWHCSLSLRAEEGKLTDEKWQAIAEDYVERMGFIDTAGEKDPCSWTAVRHGVSKKGNDHIHIVVNLVREDGTKASIHLDQPRSQRAARALEKKHGLEELEGERAGRATRGYHPAEKEAQARSRAKAKYERDRKNSGQEQEAQMPLWNKLPAEERKRLTKDETRAIEVKDELALKVRACAGASADEAEFVRRMRMNGVLVRPRYAEGSTSEITGYSVAMRPEAGERPIWYGGGRLAKDLTLPRLRSEWPEGKETAAAEWNAALNRRRPASPGRERLDAPPEMWERITKELDEHRERLKTIPVDDRHAWARVARQASGALAAWSLRVEHEPGPLGAAAAELSKTAQLNQPSPRSSAGSAAGKAAALLIAGAGGGAAEAAMLRSLVSLARAIYDVHRAVGEARKAAELERAVRGNLAIVAARLPQPSRKPAPAPDIQRARRSPRRHLQRGRDKGRGLER